MDDAIRLIITVLFIGLIVLSIVFFGIFGIAPLTKLGNITKKPSTEVVVGGATTTPSGENPTSSPETPGGNVPISSSPNPSSNEPTSSPVQNPPVSQPSGNVPSTGIPEGPGKVKFYNQSPPISASEIPENAIRITVSGNVFSPAIISVPAKTPFTVALISGNDETHVLKFNNPAFASIGLGAGPHQIRTITLSISEAGSYGFHCDVPGHAPRGEMGRFVVE